MWTQKDVLHWWVNCLPTTYAKHQNLVEACDLRGKDLLELNVELLSECGMSNKLAKNLVRIIAAIKRQLNQLNQSTDSITSHQSLPKYDLNDNNHIVSQDEASPNDDDLNAFRQPLLPNNQDLEEETAQECFYPHYSNFMCSSSFL
eukprot:UN30284